MDDDLVLGIDLGGTQVRAAVVNTTGKILRRAADLTDVKGGPPAVVEQMLRLVREVEGGERQQIKAVGVSSPGPLDSDTGVTFDLPTIPGWNGFPLRTVLAEKLGRSVILENDGIAAAHGEWKFGAGRGLKHLVYVTVSTGIGGGVVVDNKLMRGRRGMAAHVGHMLIARDGPICGCGAVGCFEALASGTALNAIAKTAGFENAVNLTHAARQGNAAATVLLNREAEWLGYGFVSLMHLFSPERLIVGGGVASALDLMRPTIERIVQDNAMPAFKETKIVSAELGDNAGLVGAASLAM